MTNALLAALGEIDRFPVDTSAFIAAGAGRPLTAPPGGGARISVATLTALGAGVRRHATRRDGASARRSSRARRFIALPCDEPVAERPAELLTTARTQAAAPARWTRSSRRPRWRTTSRSGPGTRTPTCSRGSRRPCASPARP